MKELASSPDRGTFQRDAYIQRALEEGKSIDDPDVQRMIKFYNDWSENAKQREVDPEWQKQNLEWDLRTTPWIIEKCNVDHYAQNLYAAMCNVRWQKREVIPILKDEHWSCSWRSAGGIVADLQGKGDYIDWYCSGIVNRDPLEDGEWERMTLEQQTYYKESLAFVGEGMITDEILADLKKLGWIFREGDFDKMR